MYTRCKLTIDSFRDTLFTLLAAKENKFFTDSYRKDAASSGFTLVSTSVKLKGLKAGQDIFSLILTSSRKFKKIIDHMNVMNSE